MIRFFTAILLFLLSFSLPVKAQRDWSSASIATTEVAPGIYRLFVDERVAVVAFTGQDGVLLIDAAYEQTVPLLMQSIRELTSHPLRYLVNTHIHGDHTGGNAGIGHDVDIISHHQVKEYLGNERRQGERVIPAFPAHAIPDITFSDELHMTFNQQTISMKHLPGGHTNSDIIVYFPESKVLVAGDLLFAGYFPYVDTGNGGDPLGYLNNVAWITQQFPEDVTIIGGHGPVYSMNQFMDWHQTLLDTADVIKQAKQNGMSADDMKENRILQQWESMGRFFITEDRWIDTLFPYL
jgi:cyclase